MPGSDAMAREILFNAFDMNCVVHQSPGLWTHPRDRADRYADLAYWTNLAQVLERGQFDGAVSRRRAGRLRRLSAAMPTRRCAKAGADAGQRSARCRVPAMAAVTETSRLRRHLHALLRAALSPSRGACRRSTISPRARIGWNIVTGYLDSAARGAWGRQADRRMTTATSIADEYMELVYKLWEGSWEDDAVLRDRARGIFADPAKVHRVRHEGALLPLDAHPSQRTFAAAHAGAVSRRAPPARGRDFAARHAECVFMAGPHEDRGDALCRRYPSPSLPAMAATRARSCIFNLTTAIVGRTPRRRRGEACGLPSLCRAMPARWRSSRAGPGIDFSDL